VGQEDRQELARQRAKNPGLDRLLGFLEELRAEPGGPAAMLDRIMVFHTPILTRLHPEDYPRRLAGLEQLSQIASSYNHIEAFLADMALESPDEDKKAVREDAVVLSTVHSAKGLEWPAVLIIDLVDERFPSRHALARPEDLEEERRLLYVACTRAKDYLGLFVPGRVYNRATGASQPAMPSLFVRELPGELYQERRENFLGGLAEPGEPRTAPAWAAPVPAPPPAPANSRKLGFCQHRIFGRGKMVELLDGGKCRVNFPGFGLKVILCEYLEMEP
jgi:DNA helicase-2/ATP-dependent DNA helicase PcrA